MSNLRQDDEAWREQSSRGTLPLSGPVAHRIYLKRQRRAQRTLALRLFGLLLAIAMLMLYEISQR